MLLGIVLLAVWLLTWGLCLRDCLRTPRLHALFGSQRRARIVWCATFLLVNPILVALYAFLRLSRWSLLERGRLREALVVAGIVLALWAQFGSLWTSHGPVDVKAEGLGSPWSTSLNWNQASSHTSWSWTAVDSRLFGAPRHIRVVHSGDMLSRTIAEEVARAFADEWWTEKVELWPRDHHPADGALAPDFYLDVAATEVLDLPLPLVHWLSARVVISGGMSPSPMGASMATNDRLKLAQVEFKGSTKLSFYRIGTALGAALYREPAEHVSDKVESSVIEELRERANDHGFSKHSALAYDPRPAMIPGALAALGLTELDREYAPYVHERVRFTFEDERPVAQAMVELGAALAADGWHESWGRIVQGESSVMVADKDGARLTVGRWPRPEYATASLYIDGEEVEVDPGVASVPLYLAILEMRYDRGELEAVAARAAEDPLDVDTLLVLRWFLSDDQRELLRAAMRAEPRPDADYWLALAQLDEKVGDLDRARASLRIANGLTHIGQSSELRVTIDRLAKKLELTSVDMQLALTLEQLTAAGCGALELGADPTRVALDPGGWVRLVARGEDGDPSVLTIRYRSPESDAPLAIHGWVANGWSEGDLELGSQTSGPFGSCTYELETALEHGRAQLTIRRTR